METSEPTCVRHPDVVTRLRCSNCNDLICPDCWREAAVGYKCPDCIRMDTGGSDPGSRTSGGTSGGGILGRLGAGFGGGSRPTPPGGGPTADVPRETLVRGTVAGVAATALGGLLMVPLLLGGAFLLISSGVVGWGVARAIYWATAERNSTYLRSIALTLPGATVILGLLLGGGGAGGLEYLALPAAMYGGWIVVRQR